MIEFILNKKLVQTNEPSGSTILDFVRYHQSLIGTKIGCREGDCGACTLLIGEYADGQMRYRSLTSCISPLANAHGKHVVSIEGLNMDKLTPYQQAMVDCSGSQCGMCTPGFILSFAGECLSTHPTNMQRMISAIDGNICRCTGYKSIERAAKTVVQKLQNRPKENNINWLINEGFIPAYFMDIPNRLEAIENKKPTDGTLYIGGGTDLIVQRPDEIFASDNLVSTLEHSIDQIKLIDFTVHIKGSTNTTTLLESPLLNQLFPHLWQHLKLVSSTPIRNIASVAGNLVNASPIGDLTAFFVGLNATVHLEGPNGIRTVLLKEFYKGYKQIDLSTGEEQLTAISFPVPDDDTHFNFEKVSKRRYLDIATVNTGMSIRVVDNQIVDIHISAGGVGPTPKYLQETCNYLIDKPLSIAAIEEALSIAQNEISPISDVRGSEQYKRLLLRQLMFAHFTELFPQHFQITQLT